MSVGDFCNCDVSVVSREVSVADAARHMRDAHVGDVVVVEERDGLRVPVGIVTDRDLVIEVLAAGTDPDKVAVGDMMSADLLTASEHDETLETLQRMRNRGVRRMPVVDERGALKGILTVDDFINMFAEQMEDLVRLVTREQLHERSVRSVP